MTVGAEEFAWRGARRLGTEGRRCFEEAVPYCLDGLATQTAVRYIDGVPEVRATIGPSAQPAAVGRIRVQLTNAADIAAGVPDGGRVLRATVPRTPPVRRDPGEAFRTVGRGLVVAAPTGATVMNTVDGYALGTRPFNGAEEVVVPGLVGLDVLDRGGYVAAFPQHLTVCGVAELRLDALTRLSRDGLAAVNTVAFPVAGTAVSPTVCHHIFAYLQGRSVPAGTLITARATCARNEPAGYDATRLWAFTMREFVYIGPPRAATEFVAAVLDALVDLLDRLDLPATVERAADAFFVDRASDGVRSEYASGSKYEVVGAFPDGQRVAIASVNAHRRRFGDAFDIRTPDGEPAHTACVGLGLERWATWLLSYLEPRWIARTLSLPNGGTRDTPDPDRTEGAGGVPHDGRAPGATHPDGALGPPELAD